jgi:hypothetical protein
VGPETVRGSKGSNVENEGVEANDWKRLTAKGAACLWGNAPVVLGIVVLNRSVPQLVETGFVGPDLHGLGVGRRMHFER